MNQLRPARRVFAVSDLHLDYAENLAWLLNLSLSDYQHDVLILAGDISDAPDLLEICFVELVRRFHRVLFVPGNHDLWVQRHQSHLDSLQKFFWLQELARNTGVECGVWREDSLLIVPLLSWYDFSFGQPEPRLLLAWADFRACRWPHAWESAEVASYFLQQNQNVLDERALPGQTLITFSHFVPRLDVFPTVVRAEMPAVRQLIAPVLGSYALEAQIRRLQPQYHVYGHSHLNRQVLLDGTLYINNAFAYPNEGHLAAKKLQCIYSD